ncbi:MAG: hypothetical protein PHF00_01030 [Elusimicrobia bacterium]|nr:hypothetical protein [Elusimicrobiota bacterium]
MGNSRHMSEVNKPQFAIKNGKELAILWLTAVLGCMLGIRVSAQPVVARPVVPPTVAGQAGVIGNAATSAQLSDVQSLLRTPAAMSLLSKLPELSVFLMLNPSVQADLQVAGALAKHLPAQAVTLGNVAAAVQSARPEVEQMVKARVDALIAQVQGEGATLSTIRQTSDELAKYSFYGGPVIERSLKDISDLAGAQTMVMVQEIAAALKAGSRSVESEEISVVAPPSAQGVDASKDPFIALAQKDLLTLHRAWSLNTALDMLQQLEALAFDHPDERLLNVIVPGLIQFLDRVEDIRLAAATSDLLGRIATPAQGYTPSQRTQIDTIDGLMQIVHNSEDVRVFTNALNVVFNIGLNDGSKNMQIRKHAYIKLIHEREKDKARIWVYDERVLNALQSAINALAKKGVGISEIEAIAIPPAPPAAAVTIRDEHKSIWSAITFTAASMVFTIAILLSKNLGIGLISAAGFVALSIVAWWLVIKKLGWWR